MQERQQRKQPKDNYARKASTIHSNSGRHKHNLRLLQQQGAQDRVATIEAQPTTSEQSSRGRPQDASVEVVCQQPQHDYVGEDEELDPMGWGFSIDYVTLRLGVLGGLWLSWQEHASHHE